MNAEQFLTVVLIAVAFFPATLAVWLMSTRNKPKMSRSEWSAIIAALLIITLMAVGFNYLLTPSS